METKGRVPHRDDNPLSDLFDLIESNQTVFPKKLIRLISGGLIVASVGFGWGDGLITDLEASNRAGEKTDKIGCRPYNQCLRDYYYQFKQDNLDRTNRDWNIALTGGVIGGIGLYLTRRLPD